MTSHKFEDFQTPLPSVMLKWLFYLGLHTQSDSSPPPTCMRSFLDDTLAAQLKYADGPSIKGVKQILTPHLPLSFVNGYFTYNFIQSVTKVTNPHDDIYQ